MTKNNNAVWIVVLIVVLVFLLFVMPFSGGRWGGFCGMMGNYYGVNYGYGIIGLFGWIFIVVALIAFILLIIWLIKQLQAKK